MVTLRFQLLAVAALLGLGMQGADAVARDRPFGGPPPPMSKSQLSVSGFSRKCVTEHSQCWLKLPRLLGTACSCRGPAGNRVAGKIGE